jgi:hypothetical protein
MYAAGQRTLALGKQFLTKSSQKREFLPQEKVASASPQHRWAFLTSGAIPLQSPHFLGRIRDCLPELSSRR